MCPRLPLPWSVWPTTPAHHHWPPPAGIIAHYSFSPASLSNQNELFTITHIPHEVSLLFLSPFCYSIPLDLSPHNSSLYFYILLFSQGPVQKLPPMHTLPCFSTIITYALKKLFTEIKASSAPIQWLPLQKDNLPKVTTALLFLF